MIDQDLSGCSALVIDSNRTSRAILVSHLREFGVGSVVQEARVSDARRQLEARYFDFVLCEQHFPAEEMSGQSLLDDLRRCQLLPFATIFIMITAEATYTKVAEAAESALDGYLLKPHKARHLLERLNQARVRKLSLEPIFDAIEEERFEQAALLCMDRFDARGDFWLYAARVGAELMLRVGRYAEAQELYRAVVAAKTLPWAKLGIARAQLDAGQITQATSTLENLISSEPSYVDAYDVMGRAQMELGRLDQALETYKIASTVTPDSVSRLQNLAMMTYYAGHHAQAEPLLDRTTRLGLESKMFDCQTLVLLALVRVELNDRKGIQRCQEDLTRLLDKEPDNARLRKLGAVIDILNLIQLGQIEPAVEAVQAQIKTIKNFDFDFESACNLLALLALLAHKSIEIPNVDDALQILGLRYCSNRSVTELLASSASLHDPYVKRVRNCQDIVMDYAETALALSMEGNPTGAVQYLVMYAKATLSTRLIDNAYQVLQKHGSKIKDVDTFRSQVRELRMLSGSSTGKVTLGEQKRQAGALALRTSARATPPHKPPGNGL